MTAGVATIPHTFCREELLVRAAEWNTGERKLEILEFSK